MDKNLAESLLAKQQKKMKPALGTASPLGDLLLPPDFPQVISQHSCPSTHRDHCATERSSLPRTKSFRSRLQTAWASCQFSDQLSSLPAWKPTTCNLMSLKCVSLSVLGPLSIKVAMSVVIWISELEFPQNKTLLIHWQRERLPIYNLCFGLRVIEDPTSLN